MDDRLNLPFRDVALGTVHTIRLGNKQHQIGKEILSCMSMKQKSTIANLDMTLSILSSSQHLCKKGYIF